MQDEAERVKAVPSDEPAFVAHDLNRPGASHGELVCTPETWRGCEAPADDLPPRDGPCTLGIEIGDVASFTSAAAYWQNGRLEVWTACPADPPLAKGAKRDAAGTLYERAVRDGHLWPLAGRLTPIKPFLERLKRELTGVHVAGAGADRRRADELQQHLRSLSLPWRPVWRGGGVRAVQDAQHDIREFQRAVESRALKTLPNVLFAHAIAHATLLPTRWHGRPDRHQASDGAAAYRHAAGCGDRRRTRRPAAEAGERKGMDSVTDDPTPEMLATGWLSATGGDRRAACHAVLAILRASDPHDAATLSTVLAVLTDAAPS